MVQLNSVASEAALAHGAHAVTDITGFGLAGHANEMAQASNVTFAIEIQRLPILPGAEPLARMGYQTRASATNRQFAESTMRIEGDPDATLLEFVFDAQTSGGLLISVSAEHAEEMVSQVRSGGVSGACVIGRVTDKQDVSLIIRK
jgi:selenide,water dikinase